MPTLTERLVTRAQLLELMPGLTERTLLYWMQRDPNHFRRRCMVLIGRKAYFDLQGVEFWLEEHRGAKGN